MQPQQQPQHPRYIDSGPAAAPDRTDEEEAKGTDGMECPECGKLLEDMAQRRKEAIFHYGSENIPRYPNYNTAAERKGALLGVDPQTLRG